MKWRKPGIEEFESCFSMCLCVYVCVACVCTYVEVRGKKSGFGTFLFLVWDSLWVCKVCVCVLQSPELSCLCLLPLRWVCYMSSGTWTHTLCSQDNCIIHWTISSAFSSVVCIFSDLHSFSESNNNISESSSPLQMLQVNRIIQFFFSSYTLSCCVLSKRLRRAIRYFAFLF